MVVHQTARVYISLFVTALNIAVVKCLDELNKHLGL